MVIAINLLDKVELKLTGFFGKELENNIKTEYSWKNINELGFLNQDDILEY